MYSVLRNLAVVSVFSAAAGEIRFPARVHGVSPASATGQGPSDVDLLPTITKDAPCADWVAWLPPVSQPAVVMQVWTADSRFYQEADLSQPQPDDVAVLTIGQCDEIKRKTISCLN